MFIWKIIRSKFVFPYSIPLILDLGCGSGANVLNWVNNPTQFVGCDLNRESLLNYKKKGGNPVKADLKHLPFNLSMFGTLFAFHCLEHLPKKVSLNLLTELSMHKNVFIEIPVFPLIYQGSKGVGHDLSQKSFKLADFEPFGFYQYCSFSPQSVFLLTNNSNQVS